MSKVNLAINAFTNSRLFNLQKRMIEGDNLPFFQELDALLTKYEEGFTLLRWSAGTIPFQYLKVFREKYTELCCGSSLLIELLTSMPVIKEFKVPYSSGMKDVEIKNTTGVDFLSEHRFLLTLYMLVTKPELGRKYLRYELVNDRAYLFHVKIGNLSCSFCLSRYEKKWTCYVDNFDSGFAWQNYTYLFF